VTARDALQMSLNIPALAVLEKVGPLAFTLALQNAGAHIAFPKGGAAPSLPVALGGLGISVADIAMLYAGIAEGGQARVLRVIAGTPDAPDHRLFGPAAAWYLRDILKDVALPDGWAMGQGLLRARRIGFKTGTSYGYRDAWAVGFSNDYTVAVWVGRADGTPRPDRIGREAAAPILLKMFGLLPPDMRPSPAPPAGVITARATEELPPALQSFQPQAEAVLKVAMLPPPAIAFPPNGAVVPLPEARARDRAITLKADGGRAPLTWLVNGDIVGSFDRFAAATYLPAGEGVARVTVVDADGRSDTSEIRFKKAALARSPSPASGRPSTRPARCRRESGRCGPAGHGRHWRNARSYSAGSCSGYRTWHRRSPAPSAARARWDKRRGSAAPAQRPASALPPGLLSASHWQRPSAGHRRRPYPSPARNGAPA